MEKLDCSFAFELTDHGLFQLLSLCGDNLETLDIDDTCVTCNMLSIENLPHIQNLKSLNCSSTSLVDSGLLQLLRLWGNTLTHLDIGDNDITGEGLSELGVCSLPCIEEISLWCENLSDDGLVKFLKLCKKTVKSLYIGGSSKITGEGVDGIEVRHVRLRLFCLSISIFVLIYLSLNKKCVFYI